MNILNIKNLYVSYGDKVVLRDISFSVKKGEIVALIGPNGAGKTTIIRAVSGTVPKDSGDVIVSGKTIEMVTHCERASLLSVVPQARQLGGAYTVRQAVMMGRTAYMGWLGRESDADRAAVEQALAQTNLIEFADRQIAKLSGGEQQRVLLARALAQSTPVVLLDEPTNHLDLRHQANLLRLIKELVYQNELAVVFAMHDLNLVSMIADIVLLLEDGKISAAGKPSEVLTKENISRAYRVDVQVGKHPITGLPLISIPLSTNSVDFHKS